MNRLLELRTEKELSQRQMAKILNVSQGTYNNWENENTQPSIEQLVELSRFFGVTVDYLIGNTDTFGTIVGASSLSKEETELLSAYKSLDKDAKAALMTLVQKLPKSGL